MKQFKPLSFLFATLLFFGMLSSTSAAIINGSATLKAEADAVVKQEFPDTNTNDNWLSVYGAYTQQPTRNYWSFVRFDLTQIPDNAQISNAKFGWYFLTYAHDGNSTMRYVELWHVSDDSWNEADITWNTKPDHNGYLAQWRYASNAQQVFYSGPLIDTATSVANWNYAPDLDDNHLSFVMNTPKEDYMKSFHGFSKDIDNLDRVILVLEYSYDDVEAAIDTVPLAGGGEATLQTNKGVIIGNVTTLSEDDLPEEARINIPEADFPFGFFDFTITGLNIGDDAIITLTFPENIPTGSLWYYYVEGDGWASIPVGSDDGDNVITITKVDGGAGDSDKLANGVIIDPAGVGVPRQGSNLQAIPTLSELGMLFMSLMLAGTAIWMIKRRQTD